MKKNLLFLVTFISTIMTASAQTDLSELTDAVYVQPTEVPAGSQQILSIRMKNSIEVQTIQFDLYLPGGFTIVANEDEELMTASKERINKFNYFESSIQADGALRLLAQATATNVPIGDGEIAKVIVTTDNTMVLGNYLVLVKNILLVSKDNDSKEVNEVSTTITITEPADTRTVLDETSTTVPASAANVDVRVKRTINANEWSTICLPFAMTEAQVKEAFGEDVQLADFAGAESEYDESDNVVAITANFTDVQAIEANRPYIVKVSTAITEFTVDGVDIAPSDELSVDRDEQKLKIGGRWYYFYNSFIGTYIANTEVPENGLFLNSNKFWYSTGLTKMKAFRAYFNFIDILTEVADASGVKICVDYDDATGIKTLPDSTLKGENTYNLAGQRVGKDYKGIVIENGKKVIK